MSNRLKIGIELECVSNKDLVKITTQEQKNRMINPFTKKKINFLNTHDGSLRGFSAFNYWDLHEFINVKPRTKKTFLKELGEFKQVIQNGSNAELCDLLKFNKSCGCHFHFSTEEYNERFIKKYVSGSLMLRTRRHFFKLLEKSSIKNKEDIKTHYFRRYARGTKKLEYDNINDDSKYYEFNLISVLEKKGIEWRSPNLLNIGTWAEFFELINIYIRCMEFFNRNLKKQKFNYLLSFNNKCFIRSIEIKQQYKNFSIKIPTTEQTEVLRCVI